MVYDKDFLNTLYSQLKDKDKELTRNCWISPFGHVLICGFHNHEQILRDNDLELIDVENDGWVRVTFGPLFKNLNCQCLKRLTPIQKRLIKKLLSNPTNQKILKDGWGFIQVGGWYFYINKEGNAMTDKDESWRIDHV